MATLNVQSGMQGVRAKFCIQCVHASGVFQHLQYSCQNLWYLLYSCQIVQGEATNQMTVARDEALELHVQLLHRISVAWRVVLIARQ